MATQKQPRPPKPKMLDGLISPPPSLLLKHAWSGMKGAFRGTPDYRAWLPPVAGDAQAPAGRLLLGPPQGLRSHTEASLPAIRAAMGRYGQVEAVPGVWSGRRRWFVALTISPEGRIALLGEILRERRVEAARPAGRAAQLAALLDDPFIGGGVTAASLAEALAPVLAEVHGLTPAEALGQAQVAREKESASRIRATWLAGMLRHKDRERRMTAMQLAGRMAATMNPGAPLLTQEQAPESLEDVSSGGPSVPAPSVLSGTGQFVLPGMGILPEEKPPTRRRR